MMSLFVAMVATVSCILTAAASAAPPSPFDGKAQGARYLAFLKTWNEAVTATGQGKPQGEPLPIPAEGVLTVKSGARKAVRLSVDKKRFLNSPDSAPADLGKILWAVEYAFSLKFVECQPEACFVEIFTEYSEPGFWMSLADSPTGPVLNGVVYYRKRPAEPLKDKRFKTWLAALTPKPAENPPK